MLDFNAICESEYALKEDATELYHACVNFIDNDSEFDLTGEYLATSMEEMEH